MRINPLKILLVTEFFPPVRYGGSEISTLTLARVLSQKHHEVFILTPSHQYCDAHYDMEGVTVYQTSDINFSSYESIYAMKLAKKITMLDKKYDFDIFHGQNLLSIPGTTFAGRLAGKPSVSTIRDFWPICFERTLFLSNNSICSSCRDGRLYCPSFIDPNGFIKHMLTLVGISSAMFFRRLSLKISTGITCVSNFIRKTLAQFGLRFDNAVVIPNMVDLSQFSCSQDIASLKGDLFNKSDVFVVTYIGKITNYKGILTVVSAAAQLTKTSPDIRFLIIGDGPHLPQIIRMVQRYRIENAFRFLGRASFSLMPQFYHVSDVVVFPSMWPECFGRISIETMAANRPLIATKVGAIPEVVKHLKTGILIEPGNPEELANAVCLLKSDPKLRENLSKKGHEYVRKYFSSDAVSNQFINFYRRLLSE